MKNFWFIVLLGLTIFFGKDYIQRHGISLPHIGLSLRRTKTYVVRSLSTDGIKYYLSTDKRTVVVYIDSLNVVRIPNGLKATYVDVKGGIDTLYLPNDLLVDWR